MLTIIAFIRALLCRLGEVAVPDLSALAESGNRSAVELWEKWGIDAKDASGEISVTVC